ncbi:hypothetical protein F5J12DRAFT_847501 [Pisolithus orientalis]|uniref:uncharacterized protein n=1 Tax=Pisolithus orientalis TaxID=936130 RepID=UPI0022241638|nr:uncharacterized protein F5J12DRAFT_847501 [Pisolithus orientalis]KAI5999311.1 hypothetical protein F5J12DRAFT_847501 [Pisolithus orientalis]
MSARGVSTGHVLPANPSFIDFLTSDGDTDQWPTNTTRVVDSEGHVNFMRPVPLDESLCIKWRCEVGASLAVRLNKPVGPSYVLRGWPEGYQMFDHNKGPVSGPRHDAYLMGSRHVKRFRSVPEFTPHALWLLTDPTLNRANCSCKYCNRKPQREITASMGLLPRRSTPLTGAPSTRGQRAPGASASTSASARQVRDRGKPYASIRRAPRPVKQPAGPKQNMSRERNADLRTAYAEEMELRRWFRDGELLWCALNPPILGLTGDKDAITFWPGLVEEAKIKSEAVAKPKSSDETVEKAAGADIVMADAADGSNEAPAAESSNSTSKSTYNDEDKQVPWTVVQTLWYKIKLLGIPYSYNIRADQVLPYQAHAPSDELIQAIHRVPLEQMNTNTDAFKPSATTQFAEAAAPFALAVQIAANLAGYWTPTDDWEYKFAIPPSPKVVTPPPPLPAFKNDSTSLHAVMNASMAYNASLSESISAAGPPAPTLPTLAQTQTITQTRFQGLWWGAERIWTDELVRLKLSRGQVAPQGAENILPPAGPSRKAIEYARTLDEGSSDCEDIMGAAGRGLFMLLEGLYVVDVPKVNGSTGKECRATGMLYELVDEDWEGDTGEGSGSGKENGKGKGKATDQSSGIETPASSANGVVAGSISVEAPSGSQLANPNPAVPVEGTTSDVVSHTDSITVPGQTKAQSPNQLLSHPILSSPFSLPPPPEGFKFRPVLTPGYEAVISLNLIAGRYYPRLLQHPLLQACVEKALDVESGGLVEASQLWALEGLTPGFNNTMDPVRWRSTRVAMIREADKEARQGLEEHWRARAREKEERDAIETYLPFQPLPDSVTGDASAIPTIKVPKTSVNPMEVDSLETRED